MESLVKKHANVIEKLGEVAENAQLALQSENPFEKAFSTADAIQKFKTLLTPEVMKPIMQLQGTVLGFKTDKDSSGGYSVDVVRDCMIEGLLHGIFPVNNQINIIAGNMYVAKNGASHILKQLDGLNAEFFAELPNIKGEPGYNAERRKVIPASCAQGIKVKWTYKGKTEEKLLVFPIKYYGQAGEFEAMAGKAERKAKVWLYNHLTNNYLSDAEAAEMSPAEKNVTPKKPELDEEPAEEKEEEKKTEKRKSIKEIIESTPADSVGAVMNTLREKKYMQEGHGLKELESLSEYEKLREEFYNSTPTFKSIISASIT